MTSMIRAVKDVGPLNASRKGAPWGRSYPRLIWTVSGGPWRERKAVRQGAAPGAENAMSPMISAPV